MHPIIRKTFGGLSAQYYFRQFAFGLLMAAFVYFMSTQGGERGMPANILLLTIANALLYPYSRFVYESMMGFVVGQNVFFVNAFLMLVVKCFTMLLCWAFAIFVAPLGLAYLYYHHSKTGA